MAEMRLLAARRGLTGLPPGPLAGVDTRRRLQLGLAWLWLLDGVLQFQPYMFTRNFAAMTLWGAADGDPGWVAGPVHWCARLVLAHPVAANTGFASVQVALGVGIAWRPTLKPALAASIAWALGVWWLGEGLGELASGSANPLTGAPGAALLYALLAVLLWPTDRPARFPAAALIAARAARGVWVVLWAGLAVLALLPANRAADAVAQAVTATDDGAPTGVVWLDGRVGELTTGRGLEISVTLAVLFGLIAVSTLLPWRRAVVSGLLAAVVLAAAIWVLGEGFGMPFQGMATDPNSAPLLALLAAAYWPRRHDDLAGDA